jgi:ADP-ribosylation factor GTPase-activating protein 2/3
LQPSENLYDQKPEEPALPVTSTTNNNNNNNNTKAGTSFASRFEYVDNVQPAEMISGGPQVISHISPPKSSSFFAEFGMESGFPKKGSSNYSKVQVSSLTCIICLWSTVENQAILTLPANNHQLMRYHLTVTSQI